jgi:signal transduction histidine kinase
MSLVFSSHRNALLRISVKDDGTSIDETIKRLLFPLGFLEGPAGGCY